MSKAGKRVLLSPAVKIQIWQEYKTGDHTVRSLADKYGCSKSTISNIVKGEQPTLPVAPPDPVEVKQTIKRAKKKKPTPLPPSPPDKDLPPLPEPAAVPPPKPICLDPVDFREQKLEEIAMDLQTSRASGRTSIIPQLHRLHLQIYDEVQQLRAEQDGVEDGMDTAAYISTIVNSISKFPPMVQQAIQDQLDDLKTGKIISFPTATAENDN